MALVIIVAVSCKKKEDDEPEPLPAPPECLTHEKYLEGKWKTVTNDTLRLVWNNNHCPNRDVNTYKMYNFGRCMNRMTGTTNYDSVGVYNAIFNESTLRGGVSHPGPIELFKTYANGTNFGVDHDNVGIFYFTKIQ